MDASSMELSGELSRATAATRRDEILRRFEDGGDVALDLSAVTAIDVAGVQILVSARKWAEGHGRGFRVAGAPPAVREHLAAIGTASVSRGS